MAGWFRRPAPWGRTATPPQGSAAPVPGPIPSPPPFRGKGPAEVALDEHDEAALTRLGFLPLINRRHTSDAMFYSANSVAQPRPHDDPVVTRLPFLLASNRFLHGIMLLARDRRAAGEDAASLERRLNQWLSRYVGDEAGRPLLAGHAEVKAASDGGAGAITVFLQPRLPAGPPSQPVRFQLR